MRKKTTIETCEMCSKAVHSPITIKIEGALLRVCPSCSVYGTVVSQKGGKPAPATSRPARSKPQAITKKSTSRPTKKDKEEKILVENYDEVIRKGRMKRKLSQDQLSRLTGISVPSIRGFETGKMRPTDSDGHILERELNIELFFTPETELEFSSKGDVRATTLGDIANITRFDYKDKK